MSPRYFLVVSNADAEKRARLVQARSRRSGLKLAYSSGRVAVLVNSHCSCLGVAQTGCIVGSLFRRDSAAAQITSLTTAQAASIATSSGQELLSDFWGGYVAAVESKDGIRILRDPSATFPCYYARWGGALIFASDADLLADWGDSIDLDLEEIGRQLHRAFVPAPSTALRGVFELLAGFAVRVPDGMDKQRACWSPWDYVVASRATPDELAERLSHIVRHCTAAWASTRGRLLLSVSGGLDSSILAACLATAGADTVCLTMFSDDAVGDERPFARALSGHLGLPLLERPYRLEDIEITEPIAPHLPRPIDRTQAIAYERVHLEVAREVGADAFMTGNGGDSMFGYSQSAAPIADRYLSQGIGRGMLVSLLDVCRQTGCSLSDAAGQARRLALGSPSFHVRASPLFLDCEFLAECCAEEARHPWLDAPTRGLPGKAAHIASILRVQPNLEASRGYHLPVFSPLMSQPIFEACLEIPSWEWRAGGRDRAVARRAFAADLPPAIRERRLKGSPSGFAAKLLEHFRAPIRDRLLGGRLAAQRIIDAGAIEQVLAGERPVGHADRVRILELANAEAWIEHWAARGKSRAHDVDLKSAARVPLPS